MPLAPHARTQALLPLKILFLPILIPIWVVGALLRGVLVREWRGGAPLASHWPGCSALPCFARSTSPSAALHCPQWLIFWPVLLPLWLVS